MDEEVHRMVLLLLQRADETNQQVWQVAPKVRKVEGKGLTSEQWSAAIKEAGYWENL